VFKIIKKASPNTKYNKEKKNTTFIMISVLPCPHCQGGIEVIALNCGIFIHARRKDTTEVDPHASRQECEQLLANNLIDGCGKALRIVKKESGEYELSPLDYER
jgi:hypothetical protein